MLLRLALTFLLLTTAPVGAVEPSLGWGGYHCSRWTEDRRSQSDFLNLSEVGQSQAQWVFGYLVGAAGRSELSDMSDPFIVAWVNEYCRKQPKHTIEQAAQALTRDLPRR
jgi:hypothetical protein